VLDDGDGSNIALLRWGFVPAGAKVLRIGGRILGVVSARSDVGWWVLHVDLDEFLAAVEIARRPELRGKPVVVGGKGDPTERAVVATASYAAREFGIRSGMPLRTAARRCPEAVFLPSNPPTYEAVSEQVMATLRRFPVVVEVLGWDEAFLGAHTGDPEALAGDVRRAVKQATGLVCSVGIGDNRLRAKLATGFAKPAGIYRLTRENWMRLMGERPTDALWGIGPKTAKKLAAAGITSVYQLAATDTDELARRFGPTMGPWYRALALGAGGTDVSAEKYLARSRSRETTFQQNITDRPELETQLVALAERVAADVAGEGRPAARVAVKVRFAPFFTHTRSVTMSAPTSDAGEITAAALGLLDKFEPGRAVRLLGVRADFEHAR
jgi:DNA polymerase IV